MQDHTSTAVGWHCHRFATAGQVLDHCGKIYIVIKNRKISLEIKALERKLVILGVEKFRERVPALTQRACGDGMPAFLEKSGFLRCLCERKGIRLLKAEAGKEAAKELEQDEEEQAIERQRKSRTA